MTDAVAMPELFAKFQHFCLSGKDAPQQKHGTSHLQCRARRAEAETYLKVVEDATIAQTREIAVQADLFPPPLETQDGPD